MLSIYTAGFTLGLSLILAIGAQNAFVLKQGLRQEYVFTAAGICALSDAILIFAGVAGFGLLIQSYPQIEILARYAGALFLFAYALKSFYSALTVNHGLIAEGEEVSSYTTTVFTCLAFTWLNPHVYLDTVVLLGSISTQYADSKWVFGSGAMSASFVFFFSLAYGARILRPIFSKPVSWKVLDVLIGLVMLIIAFSLVYSG